MAQLLKTTISGSTPSATATNDGILAITGTGSGTGSYIKLQSPGTSYYPKITAFGSSSFLGGLAWSSTSLIAYIGGTSTTNRYPIVAPANTTSSGTTAYLVGVNSTTSNISYANASVYFNGTSLYAGSFYASSDKRLKDNIKDPDLDCLSIINHLKLQEFNFKEENKEDKYLGIIAQDLRALLPDKYKKKMIEGSPYKNGKLSVNEGKVHYLTMGAVQQLSKKVDELEKKNKDLEKRISQLEKLVSKLL